MKKLFVSLVFASLLVPSFTYASTLKPEQVNIIIVLLQAFNADSSVITTVRAALMAQTTVPVTQPTQGNSCGGQSYPSCVGGTFVCQANGQPTCGTVNTPVFGQVPQSTNTNIVNAVNSIHNTILALRNQLANCSSASVSPQCAPLQELYDLQSTESTYEKIVPIPLTPFCDLVIANDIKTVLSAENAAYSGKPVIASSVSTALKALQTDSLACGVGKP